MINYDVGVFLRHTEMENMYVRELIEIVNQDTKAYTFKFTLYDNETPFDLTGRIVYLITRSKSGTVVQDKGTVTSAKSGLAEITLPNDMFCEEGTYQAEVQIWEGTSRLTSLPFDYNVRLSLQTNESVVADTRYSLLQEALENVAAADSTSTEAINTANQAKAICDDLVQKANTAAQNAQTALDRAESVVTQEELAQKVMLGGAPQTKFDFIENKVVQDGLVNLVIDKGGVTSNVEFKQDKEFSISVYAQHSVGTSGNKNIVGVQSVYQQYGWFLAMKGDTGNIQLISNTVGKETSVMVGNVSDGAFHRYDLIYKNHKIAIYIDGVFMGIYDLIFTDGGDKRIKTGANSQGQPLNMYKYFYIYDRELFSQDIERNFLVLNNVPSIKELHTTDSTGKTSILKLASDTDHVEDRSGRTQEQINRTFYKRMCKEIPSPSGEPITVKNGEEGYVLSAEIKGNTQLFKRAKGSQDEWIVIPNDEGRDKVAFEYKIDSTQAIISNNGETYPIYANEEDKANKKVISLDGLEGARNKLELKEDGSAIFTQESKMYSSNYNTVTSTTNLGETTRFDFEAIGSKMNSLVLCDKVAKSEVNYESQEEHIYSGANKIWVFLKNTTLNGKTPTEWLKENTLHVIAPLDTPIITHIPKELVPAILTHKTNILEVGGAVKPSSFKVTLPVDRIAELTARLEAVEAKTNTQPVNTAFVDETYAKSVNKIEEVIK